MNLLKFFITIIIAIIGVSCGNNNSTSKGDLEGETTKGQKDVAVPDSINVQLVAEGFASPVYLTQPAGDNRLFVVDQTGQIYIIKNGQRVDRPFLDIREKLVSLKPEHEERGLLGLAFHPDFKTNGKFYVYYSTPLRKSAPNGWNCTNSLSEFNVSASNPDVADAKSERILMQIDKPQDNHNAGTVAFGPDGYLYISVGDGGGANDNELGHVEDWYKKNNGGNGQDVKMNLLGSILRIDVNNGNPYDIPADNPFADGQQGLKEIFAYGLRNPYRFSFAGDGSLIAADAGQELYEEIDVIENGGNYGWNIKEGRHCFNAASNKQPMDSCPQTDASGKLLIDPVLEFMNTKNYPDSGLGIVSVGGVVYNSGNIVGLKDKYLFGVWTQHHGKPDGAIFAATRTGNNWPYKKLWFKNANRGEFGHYVLGFGLDNSGEAYVLATDKEGPNGSTGKVYLIK